MKTPLRLLTFILFLNFPFFLNGQCDFPVSNQLLLKSNSETELKERITSLQDCVIQKDTLALMYRRLGIISYKNSKNLNQAISAAEKSLDIALQLPNYDSLTLAKTYLNLAFYYKKGFQYLQSEKNYKLAISKLKPLKNHREIFAYKGLARVKKEMGDFDEAISLLNHGIQIAQERGHFSQLVNCYNELSDFLNEKELFQMTLQQLDGINEMYDTLSMSDWDRLNNKGILHLNIAHAHEGLRQLDLAEKFYREALSYFEKAEAVNGQIATMNGLGMIFKDLKNPKQAKLWLQHALAKAKAAQDPKQIAMTYDNLGEVLLQEKKYEEAIQHFHLAMSSLVGGINPTEVTQNPTHEDLKNCQEKVYLLTILSDKARAWKMYHAANPNVDLNTVLEQYKLADYLLDQMRYEHVSTSSKLFWRKKSHEIYETAIDVCALLGDSEQAFHFFEKSKSILLLDALQNNFARAVIDEKTAAKEIRLQQRVATAEASEKLAAQNELDAFLDTLAQRFPNYHQIKYNSEVASINDVQRHLLNDTTHLVEYFFGKEKIYAFLISKNTTKLVAISKNQKLYEDFSQQLKHGRGFQMKTAHQVYENLYAKLWETTAPPKGEVILIRDGFLGYIPFDALAFSNPQNGALDFLIHQQRIRYGYSATILLNQKKNLQRPVDSQRPVDISDSKKEFKLLAMAPFSEKGGRQIYLSESKVELKNLARKYAGEFFYNNEATVDVFTSLAQKYPVIHLSTHASSHGVGGEPLIEFSDTSFYMSELYYMNLQPQLVVLNACQTGDGEVATGEGILSLSRGFIHAGAGSLIFTLWSVKQNSSTTIMTNFYENLDQGMTKSQALHAAKLNYLKNANSDLERSPHHWAALNYTGADGKIHIKPKEMSWAWMLLGGGLLFGMILFFSRGKIEKRFNLF